MCRVLVSLAALRRSQSHVRIVPWLLLAQSPLCAVRYLLWDRCECHVQQMRRESSTVSADDHLRFARAGGCAVWYATYFSFSQRCSVYESRSFAKTGSGQTQRKSSNNDGGVCLRAGIYVNMTCGGHGGPADPKNSTAESCSKVSPGWGTFNSTHSDQSDGLDPVRDHDFISGVFRAVCVFISGTCRTAGRHHGWGGPALRSIFLARSLL